MKDKINIVAAIQELLQKKSVGTQEEIKSALEKKGYIVNQAKISRVLHKIGAIKLTENNKVVYRLPGELASITPSDSLKQLILNISHNESLIVIQTAPGCAQFVARFLDLNKTLNLLGTVAGDDTIFVAPKQTKKIASIFKEIYGILLS